MESFKGETRWTESLQDIYFVQEFCTPNNNEKIFVREQQAIEFFQRANCNSCWWWIFSELKIEVREQMIQRKKLTHELN